MFGGVTAAARRLELPLTTVSAWKLRDSIPASKWPLLIAASEGRLSFEILGTIKAASLDASNEDDAA